MIEAALRVIEDRGVHSLTLDAVAEEAGVTKRGLIYHFPSKSALILGLHVHLAELALHFLLLPRNGARLFKPLCSRFCRTSSQRGHAVPHRSPGPRAALQRMHT